MFVVFPTIGPFMMQWSLHNVPPMFSNVLCPAQEECTACSNRHHMMMDQMHPWFSYCLSSVKLMPLLSNNHPISKHHKKYFQENNLPHQPFLCEIRIIRHNICSNSIKSLVSCVAIKTDHLNWERWERAEIFSGNDTLNKSLLCSVAWNVHWG